MLRPKDTATPERKSLSGLGDFRLDPDGRGRAESWWRTSLAGARAMPVPASYNDIVPDSAVRDEADITELIAPGQETVALRDALDGPQGRSTPRCRPPEPRSDVAVGIRTVEVRGTQVLINSQPFASRRARPPAPPEPPGQQMAIDCRPVPWTG